MSKKESMPEGPEVKIASYYFNEFFAPSKKIKFEMISDYYYQKYSDVFNIISDNLEKFKPTFTVGKNIFLELTNNKIFNFHQGMTGGWSSELIKHCHFRVFDGNNELFFKDIRNVSTCQTNIPAFHKKSPLFMNRFASFSCGFSANVFT